jgi:hypothetical protein
MDPSALDPALSGAIDPSLGAASLPYDPALASSSSANTAVDPALDPLLASLDPATAAALQVALGEQSDQPVAVAPPVQTEKEKLHTLRTDFRAAAVSHWATLFLHHAGEEFNVEVRCFFPSFLAYFVNVSKDASTRSTHRCLSQTRSKNASVRPKTDDETTLFQAFERDLINNDDDKFLPGFLGRVLNTLANDRNTKYVSSPPFPRISQLTFPPSLLRSPATPTGSTPSAVPTTAASPTAPTTPSTNGSASPVPSSTPNAPPSARQRRRNGRRNTGPSSLVMRRERAREPCGTMRRRS